MCVCVCVSFLGKWSVSNKSEWAGKRILSWDICSWGKIFWNIQLWYLHIYIEIILLVCLIRLRKPSAVCNYRNMLLSLKPAAGGLERVGESGPTAPAVSGVGTLDLGKSQVKGLWELKTFYSWAETSSIVLPADPLGVRMSMRMNDRKAFLVVLLLFWRAGGEHEEPFWLENKIPYFHAEI